MNKILVGSAALIAVLVALIPVWLEHKSYLFTPGEIEALALPFANSNLPIEEVFANITAELRIRHPTHIVPEVEWLFINAGGWMGSFGLLHASLTEYVLFFGTAVDTTGHSGRYFADIYDTILTGTFRQWKEGAVRSQLYYPGTTLHHARWEATSVQWTANTWMLEYGRGLIPSTMPFALSDSFFSTQDLITVAKTFRLYGVAVTKELLQGNL
eukprot:m.19637 g.19637  ORF g.19637 m.19637 type:complete len:213 (+) comp31225_c0_seq1:3-641(+)